MKIKGVGKKTVEKYGKDLVDLVSGYRKKYEIEKVVLPEVKGALEERIPAKKEAPPANTKQIRNRNK